MGEHFLRCSHCRGFYEDSFEQCKWCKYAAPVHSPDGKPKIYPDRETCRAIQLAEYEQLPQDARDDPMGPPVEEPALKCACLHCGSRGHVFEAIEMRWMANENMWACPCTTCGGRGFDFDIHCIEFPWQCINCGHRYAPADGRCVSENCKCPKCGCTEASGWFDDEYDDDEFEDDDSDEDDNDDSDDAEADEALAASAVAEEIDDEDDDDADIASFDESLLKEDLNSYDASDVREWKPGDDDADEDGGDDDPMPDDIDFPRHFEKDDPPSPGKLFNDEDEDDIPF